MAAPCLQAWLLQIWEMGAGKLPLDAIRRGTIEELEWNRELPEEESGSSYEAPAAPPVVPASPTPSPIIPQAAPPAPAPVVVPPPAPAVTKEPEKMVSLD